MLERWDLHQFFVAGDSFTRWWVCYASPIFLRVHIVWLTLIFPEGLCHLRFWRFHLMGQHFINRLISETMAELAILYWGRVSCGERRGGAGGGGGVYGASSSIKFWCIFSRHCLFFIWCRFNSSSIWHLIGILPFLLFLIDMTLSSWISSISLWMVFLEACLALVCLWLYGITCGSDCRCEWLLGFFASLSFYLLEALAPPIITIFIHPLRW